MAKRITTLSNKYKTRPNNRLDSDRYQFLDITQAEPNPGNPESDGMVLSSLTSGVRSWTNNLLLRKLRFQVGSLDSVNEDDYYALVVKGNPFDGIIDSIGVKNLSSLSFGGGGVIEESDTLDTVTTRGNITANSITIGALTADSALFNFDVTIQGDLIVNGTTTTLNTEELTVEDKNILIAAGSPDALTANNAGITVDGANATILYVYDSNGWKFNRIGIFDSGIKVNSLSTLDSAIFNYDVSIAGSLDAGTTTIFGVLNLQNVPTATTFTGLFLESDGTVSKQLIDIPVVSGIASQLSVKSTDSDRSFYPVLIASSSSNDSAKVDLNLTYNASTNRLTLGNLSLTEIVEQSSAVLKLLTIDSSDIVGFRNLNDIIPPPLVETDTLDTVTTRGNTTSNSISVGDIEASIITADSTTVNGDLKFTQALLDNNNRRLLIYDSSGTVIWGA